MLNLQKFTHTLFIITFVLLYCVTYLLSNSKMAPVSVILLYGCANTIASKMKDTQYMCRKEEHNVSYTN